MVKLINQTEAEKIFEKYGFDFETILMAPCKMQSGRNADYQYEWCDYRLTAGYKPVIAVRITEFRDTVERTNVRFNIHLNVKSPESLT
jgi:hypothetical protein